MTVEALRRILDLARWAPSGDNTQPWRFEIVAGDHVVVHAFDTREHCVYDFDGRPSQMAVGALLENMVIAASAEQLSASVKRVGDSSETNPRFDVRFTRLGAPASDPLAAHIRTRSVQRRPLSMQPLSETEKSHLSGAVGPGMQVLWFEGTSKRMEIARMLWLTAHIRLTIPEAYRVHRAVIAWRSQYSEDRVPDQAIGLDPIATRLMAWVLQSWDRVEFFNTWLAGTVMPRIQLDVMPGMLCGAHFALVAESKPEAIDDYVAAGRSMQRFWLTATGLDLQVQPEMAPLIFSTYARSRRVFSTIPKALENAQRVNQQFSALLGRDHIERTVFFGRIGHGKPASARSTRLPLDKLLIDSPAGS